MSNEVEYIPTEAIEEVSIATDSESALAQSIDQSDGLPRLTMSAIEEGYVTLKNARVRIGVKYLMYVRRLVKEGKLEGIKVKVPGGTRWLVTLDSIERYKKQRSTRGTMRNYTLRLDPKFETKLRNFLTENDIEHTLAFTYEGKDNRPVEGEDVWATVIGKLEE